MEYTFRQATSADIGTMRRLLDEHGPNDWNYLPVEGVQQELSDVASGKALACLVEQGGNLVGFAIAYARLVRFPTYAPNAVVDRTGYIGDVVVHREHAGKGLGSSLLTQVKHALVICGVEEIHVDCHEENAPSRGMMRKAGFVELAVFHDPGRRFVGSRNTWLGRCAAASSV